MRGVVGEGTTCTEETLGMPSLSLSGGLRPQSIGAVRAVLAEHRRECSGRNLPRTLLSPCATAALDRGDSRSMAEDGGPPCP